MYEYKIGDILAEICRIIKRITGDVSKGAYK